MRFPLTKLIIPPLQPSPELRMLLQKPLGIKYLILLQRILHIHIVSRVFLQQPLRQFPRISNQRLITRLGQNEDILNLQLDLQMRQLFAQLANPQRHLRQLLLREQSRFRMPWLLAPAEAPAARAWIFVLHAPGVDAFDRRGVRAIGDSVLLEQLVDVARG